MTQLVTMMAALWMSSAAAQLTSLSRSITKEVVAIKDPIDKTVFSVGFSQCKNVKKIIGVNYEKYTGDEPDLSMLTLNFITREFRTTYNISAAPALIPRSQWFNPRQKLYIYMHGFTDDPTKDSYKNISNAFLAHGDCNVIALDASSLIKWLYLRSTTMVRFIGERMGEVLAAMTHAGLNPSDIHLIGHSLGSHISGFAGKQYAKLTGTKVGRISGLDPAGPCFADMEKELRLNKNDAAFVDVIHTDAGVYGLDEVIGHVDFYPNSGSQQPNCLFQTCSHSRGWLLFAESVVNPQAFPAVSCSDYKTFKQGQCDNNNIRPMGFACQPGTEGKYYLSTGEDPPYALGEKGLNHQNNDGIVRGVGSSIGILNK